MKVGLSFSRCVSDIVDGFVDITDVLVIISRTKFNPKIEEHWQEIYTGYTRSRTWDNNISEEKYKDITLRLYNTGRLHQPREFGEYPASVNYYWLETVLPNEELEKNLAVKNAWDQFQLIAGLSGVTLRKDIY
jgi:hypothetical protein